MGEMKGWNREFGNEMVLLNVGMACVIEDNLREICHRAVSIKKGGSFDVIK
jgi:hypothetical protein